MFKKILSVIILCLMNILPASPEEVNKSQFNPKPASASFYNLGLKSFEAHQVEDAITYFKQAVEVDPEFVDAYYNLGAIYKKNKDYENAIYSFKKAHDITPDDFEVVFELGECFYEQKDYKNASEYFTLIPASSMKYKQARDYLTKANSYLISGDINAQTQDQFAEIQKTPGIQAQLLVDTLAQSENPKNLNPDSVKPSFAPDLISSASGAAEAFHSSFKIVSTNFVGPTGITKDSFGNIFIANFSNNSIEVIRTDGTREIFVDKTGLSGPVGLAIDNADNLYIANYTSGSIIKVTPDRHVSIVVENLAKPYYLFFDEGTNRLYATVQGNDSLVEIDTARINKQPITSNQ